MGANRQAMESPTSLKEFDEDDHNLNVSTDMPN